MHVRIPSDLLLGLRTNNARVAVSLQCPLPNAIPTLPIRFVPPAFPVRMPVTSERLGEPGSSTFLTTDGNFSCDSARVSLDSFVAHRTRNLSLPAVPLGGCSPLSQQGAIAILRFRHTESSTALLSPTDSTRTRPHRVHTRPFLFLPGSSDGSLLRTKRSHVGIPPNSISFRAHSETLDRSYYTLCLATMYHGQHYGELQAHVCYQIHRYRQDTCVVS